jgi:hypothetical protein
VHHVIYVHTHKFVALIRCIDIGGALLDFLEKCTKWHLYAKFEFHSICTYLGGATLYVWIKMLIEYSLKALIKVYHQSPKREIESASRPLVDFDVLNNNLIKCLISCVK